MSGIAADRALALSRLEGLDVSRETLQRIELILDELDIWRQKVNLIGPREWPVIWSRHVADSLQLSPLVAGARSVVDLGSGAGFPGLILAADARPGQAFTLVESVGKKCAFLRAAIDRAALPARVEQARIESLDHVEADCVTARALAPLERLIEYAAKWLESGAIGVFPKGENAAEELTAAAQRWTFRTEIVPSRTSPTGRILILSEVQRRED